MMMAMQRLLLWFTQNPLGSATLLYITGVVGILVYTYFEPQDER